MQLAIHKTHKNITFKNLKKKKRFIIIIIINFNFFILNKVL